MLNVHCHKDNPPAQYLSLAAIASQCRGLILDAVYSERFVVVLSVEKNIMQGFVDLCILRYEVPILLILNELPLHKAESFLRS
jgi:hypothetical protein